MKRLSILFIWASLAGCHMRSDKTNTTASRADSIILRGIIGKAAVKIKLPAYAIRLYHPGDTLRCTPSTYDPHRVGNLFTKDSRGSYVVCIQSLSPMLQ